MDLLRRRADHRLHAVRLVRQRRESRAGLYSAQMDRSFRWGTSWFIFSEVMFFAAFFGALSYPPLGRSLARRRGCQGRGAHALAELPVQLAPLQTPDPKLFPPPSAVIEPWKLPLINTILLVTSASP